MRRLPQCFRLMTEHTQLLWAIKLSYGHGVGCLLSFLSALQKLCTSQLVVDSIVLTPWVSDATIIWLHCGAVIWAFKAVGFRAHASTFLHSTMVGFPGVTFAIILADSWKYSCFITVLWAKLFFVYWWFISNSFIASGASKKRRCTLTPQVFEIMMEPVQLTKKQSEVVHESSPNCLFHVHST